MTDPKSLARKSSLNPNSPFYVSEEEGGKPTGAIAVVECIRLARELKDHSRLPVSCQEYIDNHVVLKRAFQGMSGDQIAHAVEVREGAKKGKQGLTHAQLQRRWTSRENPLRKKKTMQKSGKN